MLRDVLARLKKAVLKLKPSKCHILKKSVHYLGHIVSADGVRVDHDKIKCIVEWPTPVSLEGTAAFFGNCLVRPKIYKRVCTHCCSSTCTDCQEIETMGVVWVVG